MLEKLQKQIETARPPRIWVVGDVMLDHYEAGQVSRISPEAPVPVLLVKESFSRLGGAANVALNLTALGAEVALAGVVGVDDAAGTIRGLAESARIRVGGLLGRAETVTTVKHRVLAGGQQLLRIDREQVRSWEAAAAALVEGLNADLPEPDLILVSDYDKGVISRALVDLLVARGAPLFVDPKGRDYTRYRGATLITPNEKEATLAAGVEIGCEDSLAEAARRLGAQLPGTDVLITRGPQGMALFAADGTQLQARAEARRIFDVTGAGDTAIAALAMSRCWQLDWSESLRVANVAAGIAVGKIGAVPVLVSELIAALSKGHGGLKVVSREGLAELRRGATTLGRKIVFTNGCFDLLHTGHLQLLETARQMGDLLVVAINSDDSVRRLKGPNRPVVTGDDRAAMLAGLEAVDFVTIFPENDPIATLRVLRPDVLVKGGDYTEETVVGAAEVRAHGGRIALVSFVDGKSTTKLIDGIARAEARPAVPASSAS
jgi:D-beta-D-heptose 7-phosphate kinase/D-beta-D-heptose 1-phosphate adenosyltransferase